MTATAFAHELGFADIPEHVVAFGRRCTLDLLGVFSAGIHTDLSRIIRDHAVRHFGAGTGPEATVLFDGRRCGPAGAALAGGMTIDALDAHDGHKITKGHAGCHVLPATLALAEAEDGLGADSDREFLASLIMGYEVATRAGVALHATAPDYHTSGAWGAVAAAFLGARRLGLNTEQTRHAVGIAEYHGPRSQMMRVIDHPTMLKDGSGWGAMAGISAAYLAADGFTGAPAVTVEGPQVAELWSDLGTNWRILEQYFKPHPVCRWAQPAVEAALVLCREHGIAGVDVERIEVETFHEAARLATVQPASTEEAQYSLPFPLAAAVSRGQLGALEVSSDALVDPEIRRLANAVVIVENDAFNDAFPGNRFARVSLHTCGGDSWTSEPTEPRGDPENHLKDEEICRKFHALSNPSIGVNRATKLETAVHMLGSGIGLKPLLEILTVT